MTATAMARMAAMAEPLRILALLLVGACLPAVVASAFPGEPWTVEGERRREVTLPGGIRAWLYEGEVGAVRGAVNARGDAATLPAGAGAGPAALAGRVVVECGGWRVFAPSAVLHRERARVDFGAATVLLDRAGAWLTCNNGFYEDGVLQAAGVRLHSLQRLAGVAATAAGTLRGREFTGAHAVVSRGAGRYLVVTDEATFRIADRAPWTWLVPAGSAP